MLPLNNILNYFQTITPYFIGRLSHYTTSSFYAELSKKVCYLITLILFHRTMGMLDKKVEKGDEYQNFLLKKKFFIHYFLTLIPASV
jgi:hypothetical protein